MPGRRVPIEDATVAQLWIWVLFVPVTGAAYVAVLCYFPAVPPVWRAWVARAVMIGLFLLLGCLTSVPALRELRRRRRS
jgi:hypothetical protein